MYIYTHMGVDTCIYFYRTDRRGHADLDHAPRSSAFPLSKTVFQPIGPPHILFWCHVSSEPHDEGQWCSGNICITQVDCSSDVEGLLRSSG